MHSAIDWASAHAALLVTLLVYVILGLSSGLGAKSTSQTKAALSALLSAFAALFCDLVKLRAAWAAFVAAIRGPSDPTATNSLRIRATRLANPDGTEQLTSLKRRHPYRENAYRAPRSRILLSPIGAVFLLFSICLTLVFVGSVSGCAQAAKTIVDVDEAQACIAAYADRTADPTFEGGAIACGTDVATVVEDVAELTKKEDQPTAPADAGLMKAEPMTPYHAHLLAFHHAADGGVK